jgi:murein DD-endopeptidase MepM/ murein hydrolase activator NlpD
MKQKKSDFKFFAKLKNKYRFVVMSEDSFEEKISFVISKFNVLSLFTLIIIISLSISFIVLIFSPLKEYIPGKSSSKMQNDLIKLVLKSDSLQNQLNIQDLYLNNISSIMKGETLDFTENDSATTIVQEVNFSKSKADSLLRIEVESEEISSILNIKKTSSENLVFFSPIDGYISDEFNYETKHYAVDIVGKKGAKISSVLNGTVIISSWNPETGNVIGVQHSNNYISFYKHCSFILKKVGEYVAIGEHIAIIGNSGELSTGPHLHFELWKSGAPLNPENYISFK